MEFVYYYFMSHRYFYLHTYHYTYNWVIKESIVAEFESAQIRGTKAVHFQPGKDSCDFRNESTVTIG